MNLKELGDDNGIDSDRYLFFLYFQSKLSTSTNKILYNLDNNHYFNIVC